MDIRVSDDGNVSPFLVALLQGSIKKLQRILCKKYHANLPKSNNTNKCKQIVEICLELKIDVNLPKSKYSALLHFVSTKLDEDTFKSVLSRTSKDCNINAAYKGRALLHFLTEREKENLAKYLIEFGADVNVKDKDGKTPLFYAVKDSKPIIVRTLLNHGAEIHDNEFPLETFFKPNNLSCHLEIIKMLLEAGCDVSPENKGMLPISKIFDEDTLDSIVFDDYEGTSQNWEIVKLLCAHGAEICLKNEIGTEILHYFCVGDRFDDVRFSVKHGADLFSINDNGTTTLHCAVISKNLDLIDYLLRHGLDINARDKKDLTPLLSIFHEMDNFIDDIEIVTETSLEDRDKQEKKCVELIEFLVDNGANVNDFHENHNCIKDSIFSNLRELTENLLELNAKIDFREDSPLFYCDTFFYKKEGKYCTKVVMYELLTAFLAIKINDIPPYSWNPDELDWVESFFQTCKTEVNEIKMRNIYQDRNISFFDFLSRDLREVTTFCRSEEIMQVLESGEYKKEFPSYEYLLGKRFARVQLLRNSINLLTHFLEKSFNRKFPIVILDKILNFLRPGDLRNFARALRISKDFPNGEYCIE